MKKIVIASLVALVGITANAAIGILRPIDHSIHDGKVQDGDYNVSFDPTKVTKAAKGYYIDFDLYTYDEYSPADMARLAPGDIVQTAMGEIKVETVEKIEYDYYDVNNGKDNELLFMNDPEIINYMISDPDGNVTMSHHGTARLFVPFTTKFVDDGIDNDSEKKITVPGKKLLQYLRSSYSNEFNQDNTLITVKNGQVIKFIRSIY